MSAIFFEKLFFQNLSCLVPHPAIAKELIVPPNHDPTWDPSQTGSQ